MFSWISYYMSMSVWRGKRTGACWLTFIVKHTSSWKNKVVMKYLSKYYSLNPFPQVTTLWLPSVWKAWLHPPSCQSTFARALEQRALNWDPSEQSWFVDYLAPWSGAVCWGWSCWSCLCSCPVTLSVFMETLSQVKPLSVLGSVLFLLKCCSLGYFNERDEKNLSFLLKISIQSQPGANLRLSQSASQSG